MYFYSTVFVLLTCAVFKLFRERRRMGCAVLVYIIILLIDVIVGSAIIAWKCQVLKVQEECDLAIGGTVGSLILWLLLLFICPTCVIRVDLFEQRKWLKNTIQSAYNRLVPEKNSDLYIHSNFQTALSSQTVPLLAEDKKPLLLEGGNSQSTLTGTDRISPVYIPILPEKDASLLNESRVPYGR